MKDIVLAASRFGLDPKIVFGVCMTESAMNSNAVRYEPNYKWLFNPKEVKPSGCSLDTEVALQKTSWGLMQVMGAVFREYGYEGWLTAIIGNVDFQLHYGCMHLANKIKRYGTKEGILAYNSGTPRKYKSGQYININYWIKVTNESGRWPL